MKHVLLAILTVIIFWVGKTLAMILMYASPDNIQHTFHASIYLLGSSIFIFSIYYNIDDTLNQIMKWVFSIFGIYGILNTLGLSYAAMSSSRIQDEKDVGAAFIYLTCSLIIGTGAFFMLKKTSQRVAHA